MRKVVSVDHINIIFKEMCNTVGADFNTFDFDNSMWDQGYFWTIEEQDKFNDWLARFLIDEHYTSEEKANELASSLMYRFGWKVKPVYPDVQD